MTLEGSFEHRARAILDQALRLYADRPPATNWLREHLRRLDEPVRVAVAGPPGSGKSTLVNALLGEQVAPVGDVFTWFRGGATPAATAWLADGGTHELVVHRPRVELPVTHPLERVEVRWPTRALRDLTLVDTPADAPLPRVCAEADAVLCLIRNRQATWLAELRTGFEHPVLGPTPANTIAVLCRSDEIGGGRIDALPSGRQLARRYRRDPELRALCQDVVAVAGLVAVAGRTLDATEFAALRALAALPRDDLEGLTLSADRLVADHAGHAGPEVAVRQRLLDRLGIFGVRLATTLLRTGYDDASKLSAELVQRSGLVDLRESLRLHFVERGGVLKARSALLAVEAVVRAEPRDGAGALLAELERAYAGAHDLHELRLLALLRTGGERLLGDLAPEAQRLVGGSGTGIAERLGLEHEPTGDELHHALLDTMDRWQERAESPVLSAQARRAARVVLRSCEAMLDTTVSMDG